MPVEQGLPWHPVATGLAGQAIPFFVAASHAHAPPSAPFWFPVPAVLLLRDCAPPPNIRKIFLGKENEAYQRGPNLEVDFRYTNFFWPPAPGGIVSTSHQAKACF